MDLTGTSNPTWRHEQLLISPNLGAGLIPALGRSSDPTPAGTPVSFSLLPQGWMRFVTNLG